MDASDLLTKRAFLTPDREALFDAMTGKRYTYKQLNDRSSRLARFLIEKKGVQKGDRVSIMAKNCIEYIDMLYSCAKIGAVFTPLNWRLNKNELEYIVNDCSPRVLIWEETFEETVDFLKKQTKTESYICLGSEYMDSLNSVSAEEPPRPDDLCEDDPLCILYTSGTTGKPKGALLPHRQILWNCINTVTSWGLTENDISPVFTPLFHAGGLFSFLTPLLYCGGRIVLDKEFDADKTIDYILSEKCTVILGVPTLFKMWRNSARYQNADFSHVRFFINGGAKIPADLVNAWRAEKSVIFRQGYGLTEVGVNCMTMTDEESKTKTTTIGKPIFHSSILLLDENGNEVGTGEPGELCFKGPHVCLGYWKNEEATKKALADGWFHTGDRALKDEDGFITISGRYKDMIISGGENVYAAEVEAVFREHPTVSEAALIGKPDETWGEVGVMIVVPEKGAKPDAEELISFCKTRLASYKTPKEVIFDENLPYSSYGKVMKAELRKKYLKETI